MHFFLAEVVLDCKLSGSGPRKLAISFSSSPRIAGRDSVVASDATMRPQKPKTTVKGDLFRAALEQLISMKHELVQLPGEIAGTGSIARSHHYSDKGRPGSRPGSSSASAQTHLQFVRRCHVRALVRRSVVPTLHKGGMVGVSERHNTH